MALMKMPCAVSSGGSDYTALEYDTYDYQGGYAQLSALTATYDGVVLLTNGSNASNGNILVNNVVVATGRVVLIAYFKKGNVVTYSGGSVANATATYYKFV